MSPGSFWRDLNPHDMESFEDFLGEILAEEFKKTSKVLFSKRSKDQTKLSFYDLLQNVF